MSAIQRKRTRFCRIGVEKIHILVFKYVLIKYLISGKGLWHFLQHVAKRLTNIFIIKRRLLTPGERELAYSVFHSSLKLDHIEIIAHHAILKTMQ